MKSSKNNPLVSVIIPTKNNIRTIEKCLQSVKDQTYKNIELIVVDNHSTDGTVNVARGYADKVYKKGPERSAQRNFGASKASGKYLLIHDSDVYFDKNSVSESVKLFEEKDADAVILPEKSIGPGYWSRVKSFERDFYRGNDYIEAPRFFRRSVYEQFGGYDETLTGPEDWDLMIRLREANTKTLRSKSLILHDEGKINLLGSSAKKSYYSEGLKRYQSLHPQWYKKQSSIWVRFPVKKLLKSLITHPVLTVSMIIMKSAEYLHGTR